MKKWASFLVITVAMLITSCGGGGQSGHEPPPSTTITAIGYVANTKANAVSSFLLDEKTGTLVQGSVALAGSLPACPRPTPDGRFLFVSNMGDATISTFALDGNGGMKTTGSVTHLRDANAQPVQIAVAPSGQFLFVGTASGGIEVFRIDPATGGLQALANSPFEVPSNAAQIALTRSGRFLYALGDGADVIYMYAVDETTGALTTLPASPFHTGFDVTGIAIDPSDAYVLVTTLYSAKILVFRIGSSGELIETSSAVGAALIGFPRFAPDGRLLFADDPFGSNGILAYTFDPASGSLNPVPGSPFYDGQSPNSVAISPNGNILVVARINPGHLATFRIEPQTGTLTPISGTLSDSGIVTGNSPNNIVLVSK